MVWWLGHHLQVADAAHTCAAAHITSALMLVWQGRVWVGVGAGCGAGMCLTHHLSPAQGGEVTPCSRGEDPDPGPVSYRYELTDGKAAAWSGISSAPNFPFSLCSPQSSFPLNHLNRFLSAVGKPCSEYNG